MATSYTDHQLGINWATGDQDYVSPFNTTQTRNSLLVGSREVNVLGFWDSTNSQWRAASGNRSTDDYDIFQYALEEARIRAGIAVDNINGEYQSNCVVRVPPTATGYLIDGTLSKYNGVSLIGDGTLLSAGPNVTGSLIDMVEDQSVVVGSSSYMSNFQINVKGFQIYSGDNENNITLINSDGYSINGQIFEDLFFHGSSVTNVEHCGLRFAGRRAMHHNQFRALSFNTCRSSLGAFSIIAHPSLQANNNVCYGLQFNSCWTDFIGANCGPILFIGCNLNPAATSNMTYDTTTGLINGRLDETNARKNPRVIVWQCNAIFYSGYMDGSSGKVGILNLTPSNTNTYPPITVTGVLGMSPKSVKMIKLQAYTSLLNLLVRDSASSFSLLGDYTSVFDTGTVYMNDLTGWTSGTIDTSDYNVTKAGYTTVTISAGSVPASLERVTMDGKVAGVYSSTTQINPQTGGYTATDYQKGRRIYLFFNDGSIQETTSASYSTNLTLSTAVAGSDLLTVATGREDPPLVWMTDRFDFSTFVNLPAGLFQHFYTGEGHTQVLTMTGNTVLHGPKDLNSTYATRWTVVLDNSGGGADYTVSFASTFRGRMSVVPAGWYGILECYWDGTQSYTLTERLVMIGSASTAVSVPSLAANASVEGDFTITGVLPTDKVKCSASSSLNVNPIQATGRIICKSGGAYALRLRVTNRHTDTYNATDPTIYYLIERPIAAQEESGQRYTAEFELSSANIQAMRTAIPLLASPGAGKWIEIESVTAFLDYGTAAYGVTGGGSWQDMSLQYAAAGTVIGTIPGQNFLDQTADRTVRATLGTALNSALATTTIVDSAIQIKNPGAANDAYITGDGLVRLIINYKVNDDTLP